MFSIVYVQRLCGSLDKHEEAYSSSYLSVLVAEGRTDEVNFSSVASLVTVSMN